MNNTTNPLLALGSEEIEQLRQARSIYEKIAQKCGLAPRPHETQLTQRGSRNGHNGHRAHKTRMSQDVKNRISASMRKLWQKRRKEAKSKETAPA